jgi:ABC-type transporter Mla MlaB component
MAVELTPAFALQGDELALEQAEAIRAEGEALMARSQGPYQFDLSGLERANSVTVAVLLAWYRHATLRQKPIMFVNLSQDLLNIIEFSGLRRVLIGASPHHE